MLAQERAARAAQQRFEDELSQQVHSKANAEHDAQRKYQETLRLFREEARAAADAAIALRRPQDVQVAEGVGRHHHRRNVIGPKISGWAIGLGIQSEELDQYVPVTAYSIECHILTPAGELYGARRPLNRAPQTVGRTDMLTQLRRGGIARKVEPYNLSSAQQARRIIAGFVIDCRSGRP